MKQAIKAMIFTFATLVGVSSAVAAEHSVTVNIPFKFMAGSAQLPAGRYTITSQDNLTVVIQDSRQHSTTVYGIPAYDSGSEDGKLVFTVRGNQYFLTKIICLDSDLNLELPISQTEKKDRSQEKSHRGNNQNGLWLDR